MSVFASGPLKFSYPLSPSVFVNTDVFGDARNMCTVSIVNGSITVWAATLIQQNPVAETPKLALGSITIEEGTSFRLTIPTQFQNGNVLMTGEVASPPNPPQPIAALVASWPLSSTMAAQAFLESC